MYLFIFFFQITSGNIIYIKPSLKIECIISNKYSAVPQKYIKSQRVSFKLQYVDFNINKLKFHGYI